MLGNYEGNEMKFKPPKFIYLQCADEEGMLSAESEITWCEDQINEQDVGYILFDEHERLMKERNDNPA